MVASKPRVGRARRAMAIAGAIVGTTLLFAGAAITGAVVHLDLPVTRRVVAAQITNALAQSFRGTITIDRIETLGLDGVGGVYATVRDPDGQRVLLVEGLRAAVSVPRVGWSFLAGKGDIDLTITRARVEHVEAALLRDHDGSMTLAHTFEPRLAGPPKPSSSRALKLSIPNAEIPRAWVHGNVGLPIVDADLEGLVLSVLVWPDKTVLDVHRLSVATRAMPNGANPSGAVVARLVLPTEGDTDIQAAFDGAVADIPLRLQGEMVGNAVAATVDVPRVADEKIRALVPDAPIFRPVAAHVDAKGTLPDLAATADLGVGDGTIHLDARARLEAEIRGDLSLAVARLEPRAFAKDAPEGTVTATLVAKGARAANGAASGVYDLHTEATTLAKQVVPKTAIRGAFTDASVNGKAVIEERGAPTRLDFDLHPEGASDRVVDFDVHTTIANLSAVPRIGPVAQGSAQLHAAGKVSLSKKAIEARAEAQLARIAKGDLKLEQGFVTARVSGPFDRLGFAATVNGKNLEASGYAFAKLAVTASGPIASPYVTASLERGRDDVPNIEAHASISTGGGVTVRAAEVTLTREDVTMVTKVARLTSSGGVTVIDGLSVEGVGTPLQGSARVAPGALSVKARVDDIDLMRVARLFARDKLFGEGHARVDVDLAYAKKSAKGRAAIGVKGAKFGVIEEGDVELLATVDGRNVTTRLDATLGKAGNAHVETTNLVLGGDFGEARSWRTATGSVTIDSTVDLSKVQASLPPNTLPFERMAGVFTVKGTVAKPGANELPDLDLTIATQGLELTGKTPPPSQEVRDVVHPATATAAAGTVAAAASASTTGDDRPATVTAAASPPSLPTPSTDASSHVETVPQIVEKPTAPPWHSTGVDLQATLHVSGLKGHTDLTAKLVEKDGVLLDLRSSADPDLARIEAGHVAMSTLLQETPVELHMTVPRRELDALPVAIKPAGVHGAVTLRVDAKGTLAHPTVTLTATGEKLAAEMPTTLPLDATATVTYDGARANVSVRALRDGGLLLDSSSVVDLRAADLFARAPGAPLAWDASSETKLVAFPLDSLAALSGSPIEGCVSGTVSIRDVHQDGKLAAHLDVVKLRLGEAVFPTGKLDATLEGGALKAAVRLDQTDGFLEAKAGAAVHWGADVAPTLEKAEPVALDLEAKEFRLAALLPFVNGTFSVLDGRMDASVHVKTGKTVESTHADGNVAVRKARFEMPALGQEMKNGAARITVEPDGTVRIDELGFDGTSGHVAVTGKAKLEGVELTSAEAHVKIAEKHRIPITIQGVSLGEAWGDIDVTAALSEDEKTMNVDVRIPTLHTDLAQSATHAVQDLEPEPTTKIGVNRASSSNAPGYQFVLVPIEKPDEPKAVATAEEQAAKTRYHVALHLGKDVRLKRGTQVQVYVTGDPTLDVGDKAQVSGQLTLNQGRLEVFGKRFRIEHGSVAFTGQDPSNPEVIVTAAWDAPDGTKVYVDFVGPVKTGKIKLRSEPAHSENEIVSLILFGSVDGSGGAAPSQESNGAKAAGVGGGVATQGLNKALSNITDIDVQTRVDTTDSQNPRPELAVALSRKVTAEIAYNLGLPAPGQNPDKTLFILDYRFFRHWSMLTTFGDHGSSIVDLVWQYRY